MASSMGLCSVCHIAENTYVFSPTLFSKSILRIIRLKKYLDKISHMARSKIFVVKI